MLPAGGAILSSLISYGATKLGKAAIDKVEEKLSDDKGSKAAPKEKPASITNNYHIDINFQHHKEMEDQLKETQVKMNLIQWPGTSTASGATVKDGDKLASSATIIDDDKLASGATVPDDVRLASGATIKDEDKLS